MLYNIMNVDCKRDLHKFKFRKRRIREKRLGLLQQFLIKRQPLNNYYCTRNVAFVHLQVNSSRIVSRRTHAFSRIIMIYKPR